MLTTSLVGNVAEEHIIVWRSIYLSHLDNRAVTTGLIWQPTQEDKTALMWKDREQRPSKKNCSFL